MTVSASHREGVLRAGCVPACRGCAHRELTEEESLARKRDWLRKALAPWAERVAPVASVPGEARWGYRDRVCLSTAWDGARWHFGLRVRDEVLGIPDCPVHSERVRAVVSVLGRVLPPGGDFPMAYLVGSGAQVTLVLKTNRMQALDWLEGAIPELERAGVEGLWIHLHPSTGKKVLAKGGWHLVWGRSESVDEAGMTYGPTAFQQLLPVLHQEALDRAEAYLDPQPGGRVIDLYCGAGSTLRRWLAHGAGVLGVELGGDAVASALRNAPDAVVLRGSCMHRIPQMDTWLAEAPGAERLLYANPPRTGLEREVLEWIITRVRPARMAYLSCSAGTLRRDLDALTAVGYRVDALQPFDFFPQTHHVETLALLSRS